MAAVTQDLPMPSAVLELLKPITWFPPMWAFACGVVSSGRAVEGRWPLVLTGVILAGPMVCAASQAVNDWYDRDVDAINEPQRPIPSGRIPGQWGIAIAVLWTALSVLVAWSLGQWVLIATGIGLALAWAYSAPPFRLKQNGWFGNLACGLCYEGLAWITGAALMLGGTLPSAHVLALAAMYSVGAHGIMTLNDFKAIAGDKAMGIRSLPVQLGVTGAAGTACIAMLAPQVVVIVLLLHWHAPWHALAVGGLVFGQVALMRGFLRDPVKNALSYSGTGVILFVLGMLISAFAVHGLAAGPT